VEKSQTISAPERSGRNAKLTSCDTLQRITAGVRVVRSASEESAAQRARWLAELACALDEARRLIKRLGAAEGRIDAVELYARIEAVRLEVQAIRLRRSMGGGADSHPEWTENFPWKRSA
jgi:hypothetical protein